MINHLAIYRADIMDNYEAIYEFSKHSKIFMNIINLTNIVLYVHSTPLYPFHLLIHIKICTVSDF